ncbi:MAG: Tex-like N-terminal domain-containing protein, partial [Bacteroidota bacterium]|nr:Tex-like N-terminal domain-containing protein [Bacteroidota bacterium]
MNQNIIRLIAQWVGIQEIQASNTIQLLNEGGTVPFISRYRKERTGSLDEVQIESVKDAKEKMEELLKRKETILKTILEQDLLTPDLQKRIEDCFDPTELEDIYLPYKPKRRTRASIAREKGLEPLAKIIMDQNETNLEHRAH